MDLYDPGSGSRLHDFRGDIAPSGLFWTVRLPDDAVVSARKGRRLTVDVQGLPVIDTTPDHPASVTFHLTWKARGPRRRLGRRAAPAGDPAAFSARFFTGGRATGIFSGTAGSFTFQSDPGTVASSAFLELGTERNGTFLARAASRCRACTGGAGPGAGTW